MKKLYPYFKLALFIILMCASSSLYSQVTYYSLATGNWSDVNTWSVVSHSGAVATQVPGSSSTDIVIIAATHVVTLDLDRDIASLTIGSAAAGTLIIGNDNMNRVLNVNGPLLINSNGTLQRNTTQTEGTHTLGIKGDSGNLTNNGIINFSDLSQPVSEWSVVNIIFEIGGSVTMGGSASVANCNLNSLRINKSNRNVKLTTNWTIADRLYIEAGNLDLGDITTQYTINGLSSSASHIRIDINGVLRLYGVSGFPTGYSSTIDGEDGTIMYTGTNQDIAPQSIVSSFENLIIAGSAAKTITSNLVINGNLTISSSQLVNSTFSISLKGNYSNSDTYVPGTGAFRFTGDDNQTVSGIANFSSLEVAKPAAGSTLFALSALSVSSSTVLTAGTLDLGIITSNVLGTVTGSGTLALSASLSGTTSFPSGTFTSFMGAAGTGTIEYNGSANYIIGTAPMSYPNLVFSGTGSKTLGSSITVGKNVYINPVTTLSTATFTLNLTGNFTNDGTLSGTGTGTVNFNNTTAIQSIAGTTATTFRNLTVSKAPGFNLVLLQSIRVNGTLALANSGNVELSSYDLVIGPSGSITGAAGGVTTADFSSSRMILQDGTNSSNGALIYEGSSTAAFTKVYPIGTGTIYSYAIITQLSATVTGTGSVSFKAIPFSTTTNDLVKRYWRVKTTNITSITDARLTFKYDPSELVVSVGAPALVVKRFDNNVENSVTGGFVTTGTSTFGINASGNSYLELEWRAGASANFAKTYYSYQSGSWDVPNNWTTDPAGTLLQDQPGAGGPNNGDRVIILNGRSMFMASSTKTLTSLEIQGGGVLDVKNFGSNNFGTIRGSGLLRIATTDVPAGNFLEFVSPVGGTIEYYDYTGGLATNIPYYNNVIMSGTGNKIIGGPSRTITVNGNFSVTGGTATIGFGSGSGFKLNVNIYGDVTIASGASVVIGNDQIHDLNFYKNLVNNGSVDLSNANQYVDATGAGASNLTMKGASDNSISGTGTKFDLYKLIIDKGVDQTYILDVNVANLKLFAPTGLANGSTSAPYSAENPEIFKALWVKNGTLKLGSNINIPRLSEGGNDFFIPEHGAVWLNGGIVSTYETGSTGNTGLTLYGKLRVTSGEWRGSASAGIVYRTISEIIVEGGKIDVTQIRASTGGTGAANNRSAYEQSGGEVIVSGTGENGGGAQFSLDKTSSIFRMSGGVLRVKNATTSGSIDIRADPANFEVTGGLIELTTNSANSHLIRSTVPFYNFTIIKGTGAGNAALSNNSLVVLHDFLINNSTVVFNANNLNLTIGNNFTNQGGTYTTGSNTTIFNSSLGNQVIASTTALSFNNLTIANTFTNGIVSLSGAPATMAIAGNLTLTSGTFDDGGKTVTVAGSISNSSVHTGSGKIRMNNAVSTISTLSGSGAGTFKNLEIDDASSVALTIDQTITGTLTLTTGILDIKQFNLLFTATATTISVSSPSSTKMIRTLGNKSDGGITKVFSSPSSFTYELGTTGKYAPATVNIDPTPANYGSITINPVGVKQPFAGTNALVYYWELTNTGFTGSKSLDYTFKYDQTSVGSGTESNYIAGYYDINNPSVWTQGPVVNAGTNVISLSNVSYITGDYTAGEPGALSTVVVYYSKTNGSWETPGTWSNSGHSGSDAVSIPGGSNPVFIGNGSTFNHTVTVTANTKTAGNLKLNSGSTLDLGVTTGHNFGALIGEPIGGSGKLRISSSSATAQFPAGDFGDFISDEGGTVEYYYTTTNFKPPTASNTPTSLALTSYKNLTLSPGAGTITLPDINLIVYNDLTVSAVTGSGVAFLSNTTAGVGNLDIRRDLIVNGKLQYQNTQTRTISVNNNLQVTGNFSVSTTGTLVTNLLNLNGNMLNNGVFDMNAGSGICDVTFTGTANNTLTGTGGTTDFNRLIINKGTSEASILETNLSSFTLSASNAVTNKALELQNGTFKLTSAQNIVVSNGANGSDYFIPFTSKLWLNGGSMRIFSTGTGAGLLLAGTLKIDAGTFYIEGNSGSNDNYIEVAGGGSPTIEINGGELRVGSQIRRANTSTISALNYIQNGGTVTLATQQAPTSNRALLEVLNDGSSFFMTGGSLIIPRQQAGTPTIAALYLQPSTSSVTGGTIQIGSSFTPVAQNIQIYSSIPLYNLDINPTNNPKAILTVGSLTIKNNLTIGVGTTTFDAGNFDLNLQGNFTVNGIYTPGTNTTYFNSSNVDQSLLGSSTVSFYNLSISNTKTNGVVSLNTNATITKTLSLTNGSLNDNGYIINVKERVNNSTSHISGTGGKMIFNGTAQQILAGNDQGVFGNVEINNSTGILLEKRQTFNGVVTFTSGVIDIRSTSLILGSTATIAGSPGPLSMIRTNGTLSDAGITKNFAAGTFNFTFPIGTSSKYTPAQFNASANGAVGTITIKPVNRSHPSAAVGVDALSYYWNVSSTGFSSLNITHTYTYNDADINGIESNYIAARFTSDWTKGSALGSITAISNLLIINGGASGVSFINGDYTSGVLAAFQSVTTFNTFQSGDWDTGTTWIGGVVPATGSPVIINANHAVTLVASGSFPAPNSKTTFSLEIKSGAKLTISNATFGHNFGNVSGTGTLSLSYDIFPGGAYDAFTDVTGGTIEYTGTGYTLPTALSYNNLTINSSGSIAMANVDILVRGNLLLSSGVLSDVSNNKRLKLQGNWVNNVATTSFLPGTGTVEFNGSNSQTIGGTAQSEFTTLELNKASNGLTLLRDVSVTSLLKFTLGNITTNAFKIIGGTNIDVIHSSGHIVGNFSKIAGTSPVLFPVGVAGSYLPLTINFNSGSSEITVSVTNVNPVVAKGNIGDSSNPILSLWSIQPTAFPASALATVVFQYPDNVRQVSFQQSVAYAARWSGTIWESFRLNSTASPDEDPSSVTVTGIPHFSDWTVFSAADDIPLPITLKSFNAVYVTDHVDVIWSTVTELNNDHFIIDKSLDGTHFFNIGNIASKGDSETEVNYSFVDEEIRKGIMYYRLSQVDLDGKLTNYNTVSVKVDNIPVQNYFKVFPNPTTGITNILKLQGADKAEIVLYDLIGKIIINKEWESSVSDRQAEIDLSEFPPGVYQLRIYGKDFRESFKIVKN